MRLTARGMTLLEMMIALTVLSIIAAVVGVGWALRPADSSTPPNDAAAARLQALFDRRSVTIVLDTPSGPRALTALPDGRIVADTLMHLDPLTGVPVAP